MPTDRSLWVEDKYALRCRGCGTKFTVFRRKHHCRRCGQVFCYECVYAPPASNGSQNLVDNVYQWLAPSSPQATPDSAEATKIFHGTASATATTPSNDSTALDLTTRLCRRCAATLLEDTEWGATSPHTELRAASLANSGAAMLLSYSTPRALSPSTPHPFLPVTPPCASPELYRHRLSGTPLSLAPAGVSLSDTWPLAATALNAEGEEAEGGEERAAAVTGPEEMEKGIKLCVATGGCMAVPDSWKAVVHEETAEERTVTYTIGRIPPRGPPATMQRWWKERQASMDGQKRHRLSTNCDSLSASFGLGGAAGSVSVQTLTEELDFVAAFWLPSVEGAVWAVEGSAASHAFSSPLTSTAKTILVDFAQACTRLLLSRLHDGATAQLPGLAKVEALSARLAAIAWCVVQHTAVALGATIFEHLSIFSISTPSLPLQCILYRGLICREQLHSKREMTPCDHPRVLLLAGSLSYPVQPEEALVDYIRSYSGYLDKLHQRLAVWGPDVVVVEGGVHHYLRERIEAEGRMRLLLHVGRDFLVQLSWCLHADIIADLQYVGAGDLKASTTPMGHCARFEVLELAAEQRCCGFTGFDAVTFHTIVVRGGSAPAPAGRPCVTTASSPQLEAVERLTRDAVGTAYHVALQSHWLRSLRDTVSPPTFVEALTEEATALESVEATAALTLNLGCRYADETLAVCRSAGVVRSLVRDNMVLNVVHMDQLFEGGGVGMVSETRPSAMGIASPPGSIGGFPKARSVEWASDSSMPTSDPASTGNSRVDLTGLLGFSSTGGAYVAAVPGIRAEGAASAYGVRQQKVAVAFYGAGDDSLHAFLASCCASNEGKLLYLHGSHRLRIIVSSAAKSLTATPPPPAPATVAASMLEEAQKVAFHATVAQQNAARALTAAEVADRAALEAHVHFLKGYFSLNVTGSGAASTVSSTSSDLAIPLCTPHLLNMSTAAFIEWLVYGWMPVLCREGGKEARSDKPQLRLVFRFHPDVVEPTPAPRSDTATPPFSTAPLYRDTVTWVLDPVLLLHIEYPPKTIPLLVGARQGKAVPRDAQSAEAMYVAHDAAEVTAVLNQLHLSLMHIQCTRQASAVVAEAAESVSPVSHAAKDPKPMISPSSAALITAGEQDPSTLDRLCAEVEASVESLGDAHRRGPAALAAILDEMRQNRLPGLLSRHRAWQTEARKSGSVHVSALSTTSIGNGAKEVLDAATAAGLTALRPLDDCFFHPTRTQWVRLAEPTSVLAVALMQLYGGAAPPAPETPCSATSGVEGATFSCKESPTMPSNSGSAGTQHVSFSLGMEPTISAGAKDASAATGSGKSGRTRPFSPATTRMEAIETLRLVSKAEAACPTSLACALRGYKALVPVPRLISGAGGDLAITVEVLYPHAFAALQSLYTDMAPLDFAAALLRCRPFSTDGGKSQSRFYVTEDGRFLLKSIKPMELRYFREWAPQYFARMAGYYASGSPAGPEEAIEPSTLGKVLGLYVVHVHGSRISRTSTPSTSSLDGGGTMSASPHPQPSTTSAAQSSQQQSCVRNFLADGTHCFMISEQLLFGRPVTATWDLKGSQRNRTTEQTAAVRLDVDFVQEHLRHGDFFFCSPGVKSQLMDHIARDTQLLSDSGIMDYSLMAAVSGPPSPAAGRDLYVGMIDFLHPYSSAKVLESKVKSGLDTVFGHSRRDPTIIDPASYATRFMLWMDGYFNGVPDRLFPLARVQFVTETRDEPLTEVKEDAIGT